MESQDGAIAAPRELENTTPSVGLTEGGKLGGLDPLSFDKDSQEEDSQEDDDDEEEDEEGGGALVEGAYNPTEFEHLSVSAEIKELFDYIVRYTPQSIDLDQKLRPFIPDFIPAVGDIDAFIKVPRPEGEADKLGLHVLDEPSAKQSDPTVLDLQLRAVLKESSQRTTDVKSLEGADRRPKEVESWVKSIGNLHRSKPPPTVHYAKNMPDIESLMQEWSPDFEELLRTTALPSADLDCSLSEYVEIVLTLLDIPVYKSRVQSLHVLFTLFSEFKNSQHFNAFSLENRQTYGRRPSTNRLVL